MRFNFVLISFVKLGRSIAVWVWTIVLWQFGVCFFINAHYFRLFIWAYCPVDSVAFSQPCQGFSNSYLSISFYVISVLSVSVKWQHQLLSGEALLSHSKLRSTCMSMFNFLIQNYVKTLNIFIGLHAIYKKFAYKWYTRNIWSPWQCKHHVCSEWGFHSAGGFTEASTKDSKWCWQVQGRGKHDFPTDNCLVFRLNNVKCIKI